jgi:trimeric autotransporter adhesin
MFTRVARFLAKSFGLMACLTLVACGGGSPSSTPNPPSASNPAPVLQSLAPSSIAAGGDDFTLAVNGTGFIASSVVQWNGVAKPTRYVSPSQLKATISSADLGAAGPVQVTVLTPTPGGGQSSASFTVSAPAAPTLIAISPNLTPVGNADFTLTASGTNFVSSSTIMWNGSRRPTTYLNNKQLTAKISSSDISAAGNVQITVETSASAGGGISSALPMTVQYPLPSIASLSPASSAIGSGSFQLSVNGTNFVPGAIVYWNGISRATTFVSSTQLTAAILPGDTNLPQGASIPVTVDNPSPSAGISNQAQFAVLNPLPQISAVTPATGYAGVRFGITVTGTHFVPQSVVVLNGVPQQTSYASSTSLAAVVADADVGSLELAVSNPAPGGGTSNVISFDSQAAGPGVTLTLVSLDPNGDLVTSPSAVGLSSTGRYVSFGTYVRDTCLTTISGCMPSDTNAPSAGLVSSNGRYVAFQKISGNLTHVADLEFADTCLGAGAGCSPSSQILVPTTQNGSSGYPGLGSITQDGRYVTYATFSAALTPATPLVASVYDTCASAPPGCTPSSITVSASAQTVPVASADARYMVFAQAMPSPGLGYEIVLHDSCLGAAPGCVASDTVISDTSLSCTNPSISADAQYTTYSCTPPGTEGQIYFENTCAGAAGSCTPTAVQVSSGSASEFHYPFRISNGGRFVTYDIHGNSINGNDMVYVYDSCNGVASGCTPRTTPVCLNAKGAAAETCTPFGMSDDGKYILFGSSATNLVQGVTRAADYIALNPLY